MGQQHSKNRGDSRPVIHTTKPRELRDFGVRLRDITSDTSYDAGVTMDSVCDMVEDMYRCVSGKSTHIKMPVPINGTGPTMYMNFVDSEPVYVSDLSPRKKQSAGSSRVRTSIVSRARFTMVPRVDQEMANVPADCDTTIDNINDFIQEMSVRDDISEHDIDGVSSGSRTFVSDTSAENDDDMEDLDDDGLPIHSYVQENRPKPVLKRVESIIHGVPSKTHDFAIGSPASRFRRYA
jgi:hypothetical protein